MFERSPLDSILYETIIDIKKVNNDVLVKMRKLCEKSHFKDCLELILKIGMYMRGWDGCSQYPLKSKDTNGKVDETKLMEALWRLKDLLETDWYHLRDIYLMKYNYGKWTIDESYPTLIERLSIVLNTKEVDSCIRMTSNVFVATSWIYLSEFYEEISFDIKELSFIF